ncbi:MAG: hypothetical protein ABR530_09615 [Pyrinomonadaceae bacterium]
MSKDKIIVFGILFWYPLAGVTYQFLHYLIGLRRLGYDVYYVEDSGRWIYDPKLNDLSPDASNNIAAVAPILEAHGFAGKWAFRGHYPEGSCYGMTESQILQLYKDANAFLNVTGAQELRDEHMAIPRRIYVESDPFAVQAKAANGDESTINMLDAHDTLFTFGENLGQTDCTVPVGNYTWHPTRQPVVMDLWQNTLGSGRTPYNTITTWHNKGKNITYDGDVYYWTKDREFEKFLDLPLKRPEANFELATCVDDGTLKRLGENGWKQVSSIVVSENVDSYRSYIQSARAEFTVARDQYVRPHTGWFSDRSACYLAAGRPVITQETGFSKFLPSGKGLFGFENMDDILAAIDEIESDYSGNCDAAREIAGEYFETSKVVGSMMERAGL